jgi:predicted enzyme related to lactoylglutathione lyase
MRKCLIVAVLPLVLLAACSSSDAATDTTAAVTESGPGDTEPTSTAAPADESTIPDSTEAATTEVSTTEVSTTEAVTTEAVTTEVESSEPQTTDVATSEPIMDVTDATLPDPALADAAPPDGSILMVKLPVGDDEAAQEFYGTVFGVTLAMEMGDRVRIVTFPGGGPGLVLIPEDPENERNGSFIVQVTNMESTLARAVANGATLEQSFQGEQGGGAQSTNIIDPWGNQIEVLQLG